MWYTENRSSFLSLSKCHLILLGTQVLRASFTPIDAKQGAQKQDSYLHTYNIELGAYLQISEVGTLVSIYNLF